MARTSRMMEVFAGNEAFAAGQARARSFLLIGQEMRKLRELQGLTQEMLAERTGVDQADISRLESGKWGSRGISFDILGRLLPVFGLRVSHRVEPALEVQAGVADKARLASAATITDLLVADA